MPHKRNKPITKPVVSSLPVIPVHELIINAEYIRELNTKVFNTPKVFLNVSSNANITLAVNVNAKQLEKGQSQFEIVVIANCVSQKTVEQNKEPIPIFEINLQYGAVVTLPTLKASNVEDLLMVEAPKLLFPEIRNIILNLTRISNLPSVLIQPIDFTQLWKDKKTSLTKENQN